MIKIKFCPECKEESLLDYTCTNCGLVFEEKPIDFQPPIKESSNGENKKVTNFIKKSTNIKISETKNPELKRALRKYYYPWEAKRDSKMKNEFKKITESLNLGKDFVVSCFYTYMKIAKYNKKSNKSIFKGAAKNSIETIAQGVVYLETRKQSLPFTLKDFEKIGCNKKDVMDNYKRIVKEFGIKIPRQVPQIFINKIVSQLKLESRKEFLLISATKHLTENIIAFEEKNDNSSKYRSAIDKAGCYVYLLTSKNNVTQKKICDVTGCNVQTLRNRIKEVKSMVRPVFLLAKDYSQLSSYDEYDEIVTNFAEECKIKKEIANLFVNPKFLISKENGGIKWSNGTNKL